MSFGIYPKEKIESIFTPLRIYNAHGNCYFALINRPRMGDLIVQRCNANLHKITK